MRAKLLVVLAVATIILVVIFGFRNERRPAVNTISSQPVRMAEAALSERTSNNSATSGLKTLREISSNPSNTLEGATTSYEIREMIAERLNTNEAFRQWATTTVTTAVCGLVQNPKFAVYGSSGICSSNLDIRVDVAPVGGLRAKAIYDPNTNSEGPLEFVVEGGRSPCVSMVQNRYRMFDYQTDEQSRGSPEYPRQITAMDWGNAIRPLDTNQLEAMARGAYFAMTGGDLAATLQTKFNVSPIIDPTIQDSSVQATGKPGARVATILNRRYPYAWVKFFEPDSQFEIFSGELFQSAPGRGELVEIYAPRSRDQVQDAIFELGDKFLTPIDGNWAQEVYSKVGSTPPEQVFQKLWKMPKR